MAHSAESIKRGGGSLKAGFAIRTVTALPEPKPRNWRQYLPSLPLDPWGKDYQYKQPGTHNPSGYDLYSMGKDRLPDTADDIGNWKTD